MLHRRDFIRQTLALSAGLTLPWPGLGRRALAAPPSEIEPTLLSMMLRGGPDLRHLIVPPYDPEPGSYGYLYWSNRALSHGIGAAREAWEARWTDAYDSVELDGVRFGVLKKAGWLRTQIEARQVAIVSNVLGATSRNHKHAELVYESGDRTTQPNSFTRDGWGGRLAQAVEGNAVSMINSVRLFINGTHPSDATQHDNRHVITAPNTRELGLWTPEGEDADSRSGRAVMSRALTSYYASKSIPDSDPYHRFIRHERTLRAFGELVNDRLADQPIPENIALLYGEASPLNTPRLGEQMRNVYDSFICSDILNFRVGSMLSDGWDSHRDQLGKIEPNLQDLFGNGACFDSLWSALAANMPQALPKTALVIGGEFGRQLQANGDGGTDHGRGMTVFIIGNGVQGGLYGDLFPDSERERYAQPSADIEGQTGIEALFNAVCEGMGEGMGAMVFPNGADAPIEPGVDLRGIWQPV